jgi:hypothetical protein
MRNTIFQGIVWGGVWGIVLSFVFILVVPIYNKWTFVVLAAIFALSIAVGLYKSYNISSISCSECNHSYKSMSKKSKCPNCGHIQG